MRRLAAAGLIIVARAMGSQAGLAGFLRAARPPHQATPAAAAPLTVVLGNAAADADSIVSALCLAYLRSSKESVEGFVPVVSVSRSELALRRETELLLKEVNLELSDLICLDEIASSSVASIILVDHNTMSAKAASQLPASASVVEIYDHHVDAQKHLHISPSKRQIAFDAEKKVATVGSTCTLVAELFLASSGANSKEQQLDSTVSTLLLGVIALDTANGDPAVGKACPRDLEAMTTLEARRAGLGRDALFEKLKSAKMDVSFWRGLTVEQCLLLDYKQQPIPTFCHGPEVGVASVLLPVMEMLGKPDFASGFSRYMVQCDLDMLGVMSFVMEPVPQRELLLVTRSAPRLEQVSAFFLNDATLALSELAVDSRAAEAMLGLGLHVRAFAQGNVKASRKQVLPLVSGFYESIADTLVAEDRER